MLRCGRNSGVVYVVVTVLEKGYISQVNSKRAVDGTVNSMVILSTWIIFPETASSSVKCHFSIYLFPIVFPLFNKDLIPFSVRILRIK